MSPHLHLVATLKILNFVLQLSVLLRYTVQHSLGVFGVNSHVVLQMSHLKPIPRNNSPFYLHIIFKLVT